MAAGCSTAIGCRRRARLPPAFSSSRSATASISPPAYFAAQLLAMQPGDPNAYPLWSLQQMPLLVVQATPASFIAQPLITMTLVEPGTLPVVAPSSPVAITKLG